MDVALCDQIRGNEREGDYVLKEGGKEEGKKRKFQL